MNSFDRERDGLRGLVRTISEESISTYSTQNTVTIRATEKATYSPDGRVLERRKAFPDNSEWVTTYAYDPQQRLISESYGREGQPASTQQYTYEKGHRTKTVQFPAFPRNPGVAVAGTPWEDSSLFFMPYDGGTLVTVYNERGQASEGEFRNLEGQLVVKFLRDFDSHGRLMGEKQELGSELGTGEMFNSKLDSDPAEFSQFNEAQKKALGAFMAREFMAGGADYKHDNRGRLVEKNVRRGAAGGETTRYEYNEHGDVSTETIITLPHDSREWSMDDLGKMTVTRENPPASETTGSTQSQRVYDYFYDTAGNWTRRTTRYRSKPDEPWTETQTTTREITYY